MTARFERCARGLLAAVMLGVCASHASAQSAVVARMAQEEHRCVVNEAREREACAAELLRSWRARAEEAFIVAHALRATETEVAEIVAYNEAFDRHDRSQRARKLAQIDVRLGGEVDGAEREQLERFRAVLVRLARYEADLDAGTEARVSIPTEVMQQWIEATKLDAALYARYGGSVGLHSAGPYAHGARAALVVDYLRAHEVQFLDGDIERRFHTLLAAPPRVAFRGAVPDFTPFWKRPIPASYIAD